MVLCILIFLRENKEPSFFLFWISRLKQPFLNQDHYWLWVDFGISVFNYQIHITVRYYTVGTTHCPTYHISEATKPLVFSWLRTVDVSKKCNFQKNEPILNVYFFIMSSSENQSKFSICLLVDIQILIDLNATWQEKETFELGSSLMSPLLGPTSLSSALC